MKFSALKVDFSSPSFDPIGSRMPAQASVKDGYPPPFPVKSGYSTAIISCSVKTIADGYKHASNSDKLFIDVIVDDLE